MVGQSAIPPSPIDATSFQSPEAGGCRVPVWSHRGAVCVGSSVCRRGCIGHNIEFGNRVNQVDLRVTKGVRFGRYRVEAIADFYNAFNVAPILTYTTTYGPSWLTPASIL
jgi:hypothetical protein